MESAVAGFFGAIIGALLGFWGSLYGAMSQQRISNKEVFTRTVTEERAKWRSELRTLSVRFTELARKLCDGESKYKYELEAVRVEIRLRLNPDPEHKLDATILGEIKEIAEKAGSADKKDLTECLEKFEADVQRLIKAEWDKSKNEAITGNLQQTDSSVYNKIGSDSSSPSRPHKGFLDQLVHAKPEDLNLKFFFDIIRNITISAALMATGILVVTLDTQVIPVPCVDDFVGIVLVVLGFAGYVLNVMLLISPLVTSKLGKLPYVAISLLIFVTFTLFFWVTVAKLVHSS